MSIIRCTLGDRDGQPPSGFGWEGALTDNPVAEARMDPWVLVSITPSEQLLFGFCLCHPITGGLAWTRSSPVVWLRLPYGLARTASGRRYALGRQIAAEQLPTEEARVAYSLLVRSDMAGEAMPSFSVKDRREAGEWIAACKAARHLGLDPPPRDTAEVRRFTSLHLARYLALRGQGKEQ